MELTATFARLAYVRALAVGLMIAGVAMLAAGVALAGDPEAPGAPEIPEDDDGPEPECLLEKTSYYLGTVQKPCEDPFFGTGTQFCTKWRDEYAYIAPPGRKTPCPDAPPTRIRYVCNESCMQAMPDLPSW